MNNKIRTQITQIKQIYTDYLIRDHQPNQRHPRSTKELKKYNEPESEPVNKRQKTTNNKQRTPKANKEQQTTNKKQCTMVQ